MNQKQFMEGLRSELSHLSAQEIEEILADYEEHFSEGRRHGRPEEEIARSLGHPRSIARHVMADRDVKAAESSRSISGFLRATLSAIGTGLRSAVLIVGPFVASAIILIVFLGMGIAMLVGGLAASITVLVQSAMVPDLYLRFDPKGAALVAFGIACIGGVLMMAGVKLASALYDIALKHLKVTLRTSRAWASLEGDGSDAQAKAQPGRRAARR
jgi:uncharacterized membrane protein